MGFTSLIDILGSFVIGGLLFLILLRMNDTSVQNNFQYGGEKVVQQNLVDVVRLIEYDFRKIGYCNDYTKIPNPTIAIIQADSSSMTFITDMPSTANPYGDGNLDTLKYWIGATSELTVTPNPNDKILYRRLNHDVIKGSNLGVTQFKLTYYDALGNKIITMPATPPFGIAAIQIDVSIENPAAYGNDYGTDKKAIWRQIRMASRNFMLR